MRDRHHFNLGISAYGIGDEIAVMQQRPKLLLSVQSKFEIKALLLLLLFCCTACERPEPPSGTGPGWFEQGPGPIISGQVEGIANRPVAGAVSSIAPHPTDSDIFYIGSVSGGIWKTENARDDSPTWAPLTDSLPSLSIGSVIFNPCDEQGETLYASTGRFSSGNMNSAALGLYGTTDGGQSWQIIGDTDLDGVTDIFPGIAGSPGPLTPTGDFAGVSIRNLVAGPCIDSDTPVLLAGTTQGLYRGRFRTAANNWIFSQLPQGPIGAPCLSPNPTEMQSGDISWLIRDSQDPGTFYAAIPGTPVQIFSSTDAGNCWTLLSELPTPEEALRV